MGWWNGKDIQIKWKIIDKNTADEVGNSKNGGEQKSASNGKPHTTNWIKKIMYIMQVYSLANI